MSYFLLVFDRASGRLVDEVVEYEDAGDALAARFTRELRERTSQDIEVVVLGAQNREALEKTHSRYFGTAGDLTPA